MWLHTPPSSRNASRKLYHPWSGPFRVVKQISESTYRVQQIGGRRIRKIVHFNRLKPCPPGVRLQQTDLEILLQLLLLTNHSKTQDIHL